MVQINKDHQMVNAFVFKALQIIMEFVLDAHKALYGVQQRIDVYMFVDKMLLTLQVIKLASATLDLDF